MPRPGPRPYECVRRAWHSDRHQPMRGSLIQQIFRAVNEIHTCQTKKNKEWQQKLPVVVLKAEEIIYSKANSEAEYMDLQTLWDRTNDAINTIIRREDGIEDTPDLLHPCIEAALILGCTARRASRSQRNCNPRTYLPPTPTTHQTSPLLEEEEEEDPTPPILPYHSSTPLNTSPQLRLESHPHHSNPSMSHVFPFSLQTMPSISPLLAPPPHEKDFLHNFITLDVLLNTSTTNMEQDLTTTAHNPSPSDECDLSLRLGGATTNSRFTHEVEDIGSSSSQEGTKSCCPSKEYCFFPRENANDTLDSSSTKQNLKGKRVDLQEHKEPVSNFVDTPHLTHHPNFLPKLFFGRMNNSDK